ncbi:hypothetical protein CP082626L3_0390A, partial [Chlamydia psittaci 08-2626_L3]
MPDSYTVNPLRFRQGRVIFC